ncbi:lactonase family protein [Gemmatimonas groenlandica]|uniref:Beta-propeller fold lactonase family protein n=1 Tax=Gemmatimonas groenlandica TaxID=2732249 RepID=A0A6M4IYE1_9BACT|nr:beta-propeller fold lactonase family protein [Gemmatimonas groenlandica]QJR37902.1 beta-propeller fold lactonase family protein [Gemmatimonas groenlandica]
MTRTLAALSLLALAACSDTAPTALTPTATAAFNSSGGQSAGAVYTSTNDAVANEVIVFQRSADGRLSQRSDVPTGGTGSGASNLGSQGSVTLAENGRWLLVTNAGSNDVSVFRVDGTTLTLTDREPSGGTFPVSVAIRGSVVYVLNAGMPNNVQGFTLSQDGTLSPLAGATQPLSAAMTGPAQVAVDPQGTRLVVTEKGTNRISTYPLSGNGQIGNRVSSPSASPTPFGFAFDNRGRLVVSEAVGGAPNGSVLSTYAIANDGTLQVISASVPTLQTAACWVVITNNGRLVFTTNTGSGSVSGFERSPDNSLSLLASVAANTGAGSSPIDMALSRNSQYAYILSPGNNTLRPYTVNANGTLSGLGPVNGIPSSAYGLAAQ